MGERESASARFILTLLAFARGRVRYQLVLSLSLFAFILISHHILL